MNAIALGFGDFEATTYPVEGANFKKDAAGAAILRSSFQKSLEPMSTSGLVGYGCIKGQALNLFLQVPTCDQKAYGVGLWRLHIR